jgi:predicted Zn-ribbon and HTH transcriptional regulator
MFFFVFSLVELLEFAIIQSPESTQFDRQSRRNIIKMSEKTAQVSTPVMVTAVPVQNHGYNTSTSATPVYAQSANSQQAYIAATAEPASSEATCRQCGRRFTREPGVNTASAAYFRCEECNSSWTDIFAASCVIS